MQIESNEMRKRWEKKTAAGRRNIGEGKKEITKQKKKKKKKLDPIAECNTGSDVQLFLKQEEDSALFHDFKFKKKS